MYTANYIKTFSVEYVEWDTDPGSQVWSADTYPFEDVNDDTIKELVEIEDESDFIDAIRELIQEDLLIGTVKSFTVKDSSGKIVCEYDDGYW